MASHLIFFGTYTRSTSKGIYASMLDDDTGVLSPPTLAAETPSPTWIALSPDRRRLYAVHPSKAQAVGYAIDVNAATLSPLPQPPEARESAGAPCHIAIDASNRVLMTGNYAGGYVATMAIRDDGSLAAPTITQHHGHGPNPQRQDKPHVHSVTVTPDNRYALVCDLGLDKIFTYTLDVADARLTPATPAFIEAQSCSGPRHFAFGKDGRFGYNITEMGATVVAYAYESGRGSLVHVQTESTLPADYQAKWGADVHIHPNGRFLYASNRGHDSIAVFAIAPDSGRLTFVERIPSGGRIPRGFGLSPNGKWLVCAHQDSGDVTVFRIDPDTGRLARTASSIHVAMGVCVAFCS